MRTYSFARQTDELKKLIAEHPDYQICVLAGEEANGGDCNWMLCTDVRFGVGEILDTEFYGYDDCVFTDRDELEEYIEESMDDEGLTEEEFDAAVKAKLKELEPFWKDVIFIRATN